MRNKKSIIAVVAVCILGIVGTTIAYYTTNKNFANVFRTSDYSVSVTEEFESPNDWTPGTTTDKKVIATNTGNVDAAVRVSYVESWEDANGNSLPLVDNQSPAERYAVINFANTSKWIESEENDKNYYYYKYRLAPGATTPTFIDSVTYNEQANIDVVEECEDDDSTCTLTLDGHAGGKYKLTITVETAQYDKYKEIWGTEVEIAEEMPVYEIITGDLDTVGSEVCIDTECFYVIGQEDENHVKLFAKYNLHVGNGIDTPIYRQDSTVTGENNNGNMKFSEKLYWLEDGAYYYEEDKLLPQYGTSFPVNVYTNEKVDGNYILPLAMYVDNYVEYLSSQGVNVTGRLVYYDELVQNKTGDWNDSLPSYWLTSVYWLGTTNTSGSIYTVQLYGYASMNYSNNYGGGVRPLIILEK